MSDKVTQAIETLRKEMGMTVVSLWGPGGTSAEVQAILFAKDEDALRAAAADFVSGKAKP